MSDEPSKLLREPPEERALPEAWVPSEPHPFYYGWWGRHIGRTIDRVISWWKR